ncbi:MAG TPA: hypothetical protein PLA80_12490 [Synergistaceae bacterium]|nr:hypothetical protein [Synergistaceae bacterium]
MKSSFLLKKRDFSLQVILLLIASMTMLLTGALLFPIGAGKLPYYEKGLYGLLLFIFALQIIILGETPLGRMKKSKILLFLGTLVAATGIITCFIPDLLGEIPRFTLFLCFGPGGLFLLLHMIFSPEKLRTWMRYGGIFRHLALACGSVYSFSVLMGSLLWNPRTLSLPLTALGALFYGIALLYLALVLHKIHGTYPESREMREAPGDLTPDQTMLFVTGIFMILLGVLLVPVSFGMLPFSGSAQLGLLMVIFAVQMLAFGNTPLGAFPRSWLMLFLGLFFGALGIISCIIPGILVKLLTILVGGLNILGGSLMLGKLCLPLLERKKSPRTPLPGILVKLYITQLIMNLLSILFGTSMFCSQLLPGHIIGVILTANGVALLYLLFLLLRIEKMKNSGTECS